MTCSRARPGEDPWGCSHAHLHAGSDICFTPCSNGDHTICMEVKDECSGISGDQELEVQAN